MSEPVRNNSLVALSSTGNRSEQLSPFYSVNVDCWENIMEFLSIKDIFALSKTCKRMRQICGYYLNEYLPGACYIGRDVRYPISFGDHLSQFIKQVLIDRINENVQHILNAESYCSLKTIVLYVDVMTDSLIDSIKGVLKIIENIEIHGYTFNFEIHEKLLRFCPKLKRLTIVENWIRQDENSRPTRRLFFQQIIPSLEYFEYMHCPTHSERNEIHTFLERNPNVEQFCTNLRQLWLNRDSFINSNVRLDRLNVHYRNAQDMEQCPGDWPSMQQFVNLLQKLHQNGFYKTLSLMHFDYHAYHEELVHEMTKLTALKSFSTDQQVDLSPLVNLKEVCIYANFVFRLSCTDSLATNLVNLEKLVIYSATTDEILPFFRHSKHLKMVRVISLSGPLINDHALDLFTLNMERLKLGATQRVTIHVVEKIYLATKMKEINSNLSRVEIVRLESESPNELEEYYYDDTDE